MRSGVENKREPRNFKPVATWGGLIGLGAWLLLTAGLGWGLLFALAETSAVVKWMLLAPFIIFAFGGLLAVLFFFAQGYMVTSEGLIIRWGVYKKFIPWTAFKSVERVKGWPKIWPVFGINWPGYCAGAFNVSGLGVMTIFGTELEDRLVVLRTTMGIWGVTPAETEEFLEVLQRRSHLLAQQVDLDAIEEAVLQPVPSEDNIYLALAGLNFVCVLGFVAYIIAFFPGAVQEAALRGVAGPPRELILLAVIAVAMFVINLGSARKIYQNMPAGGYLLWGIGIFITLFFAFLSVYVISFAS